MARTKRKLTKKQVRKKGATRWSLSSLGIVVIVLLVALMWIVVLMRNAAEEQLQSFGVSSRTMLEQLSVEMDTIDVAVLEAQTQLLDEE